MSTHQRRQSRIKIRYIKKDKTTPLPKDNKIRKWLRKFKLSEYESIFNEHYITVEQLTKLTATELSDLAINKLKMKQILHRKRFVNAVLTTKQSSSNKRRPKRAAIHRAHRSMSCITFNYNTDDSKQCTPDAENSLLDEMKEHNCGGYKLYLFENETQAQTYKCAICHQVTYNAVELACDDNMQYYEENNEDHDGIFYCQSCLNSYLRDNNDVCPINPSHHNAKYRGNRYIRKRVNNLVIYCPRSYRARVKEEQGTDAKKRKKCCEWTGKLSDLLFHLENQCKYKKYVQNKNGKTSTKYGRNRVKKTKTGQKNDRLEAQIKSNLQQIEVLTQKMQMQYEQMNILKEENKNMKSKLNKHSQDMLQLKIQNKQLSDNVERLNTKIFGQSMITNTLNQNEMQYVHPTNQYESYHTKILIQRKVHKSTVSLIHSMQIEPQVIQRKYHSKIRNSDGYWTCCNGDKDCDGCAIESTQIMIYPCCGKKENSAGCMNGYLCCGGNINAVGCSDNSYYPCCNRKQKANGCEKRYICCKQPYPKAKGCQMNVQ